MSLIKPQDKLAASVSCVAEEDDRPLAVTMLVWPWACFRPSAAMAIHRLNILMDFPGAAPSVDSISTSIAI